MILLKEQRFFAVRKQQLMNALAEVGKFLRQKLRASSVVGGLPGLAAVFGSKDADCGNYSPKGGANQKSRF